MSMLLGRKRTLVGIICLPKPQKGTCISCGISYKGPSIVGRYVYSDGTGPSAALACDHCTSISMHHVECPECSRK